MGAAKQQSDMEQAAEVRHRKALEAKRRVHAKLEEDMGFRVLYTAVARTFADQLRQDLADLQAGCQVIQQPLSPLYCQSACCFTTGLASAPRQGMSRSSLAAVVKRASDPMTAFAGREVVRHVRLMAADVFRCHPCVPSGRPRPSRLMTSRR